MRVRAAMPALSIEEQSGFERLNETERQLLSLLRFWLTGWETRNLHYWEMAWNELAWRFGPPGARIILASLDRFVRATAGNGTCRLSYHRPCCGRVSKHETLLLAMISGRWSVDLRARAAEIIHPAGVPSVLQAAARFTLAFESARRGCATWPADQAFSLSLH